MLLWRVDGMVFVVSLLVGWPSYCAPFQHAQGKRPRNILSCSQYAENLGACRKCGLHWEWGHARPIRRHRTAALSGRVCSVPWLDSAHSVGALIGHGWLAHCSLAILAVLVPICLVHTFLRSLQIKWLNLVVFLLFIDLYGLPYDDRNSHSDQICS